MVKEGDLIGIAYGEVYFVGDVAWVDGVQVVTGVSTYRPVSQEVFDELADEDSAVANDSYDTLHVNWRHAVAAEETEEGYEEFSRKVFREQRDLAECSFNELWFFDQDISGPGEILCTDMELHEKVSADMKSITGEVVPSWEASSWTFPAPPVHKNTGDNLYPPIEWDVIYNWDAAEACNRFSTFRQKYPSWDEWNKKTHEDS